MRLVEFFTEKKRLDDITDADIAALVSWRKGQGVSNATVNRTALIPLKTIFNRAKRAWKQTLPKEPYWRSHMLKEPQERVRRADPGRGAGARHLSGEDHLPWFTFARLTGLRLHETLIEWKHVKDHTIERKGKGGRIVKTVITPQVRAILDR